MTQAVVTQAIFVKSVLIVLTLRNFKKNHLSYALKFCQKKKKVENVSVGIQKTEGLFGLRFVFLGVGASLTFDTAKMDYLAIPRHIIDRLWLSKCYEDKLCHEQCAKD